MIIKEFDMCVLVTGGAGYIGSHVVKQLLERTNKKIIIIDNLSTGFNYTIEILKSLDKTNSRIKFYNQDLSNLNEIENIFKKNNITEIIHFAAFSQVAESVKKPLKYYSNNTINTINLIKLSIDYSVEKFVFSSTAAVFGEPNKKDIPIKEDFFVNPINPYGSSKLFSEKVIKDAAKVNKKFKYVIFRYFNVAGADADGLIGECHDPETHLIPLIVKTALGRRESVSIYGEDYDTKDGTCIRDYIHVMDLSDAHIKALEYLENNPSDTFNCGYGYGYSVKEVVEIVKKISGVDFKVINAPRREGDPAVLISDCSKIKETMKWIPKYDDLELICKSSFEWEKNKKDNKMMSVF